MTSLQQLGENTLLQQLLPGLPANDSLITGPGDDCAVAERDETWDTLLKTDVVVEGVHFTRETPPQLIGRKALARALSDIAAMGGLPEHALITLLAHPSRQYADIESIYDGISRLAEEWNVSVAGGETSSLPCDGLIINVSLTGKVPRGKAVLRSTAKAGDLIAVTGELGNTLDSSHHLNFTPRIREADFLRANNIPTSMMDVSDGLFIDLKRLARASGVNFILNTSSLPCRNGCTSKEALSDGEDYELIFTLNPHNLTKLQQLIKLQPLNRTTVTVIGQIVQHPLLQEQIDTDGWQHFVNA